MGPCRTTLNGQRTVRAGNTQRPTDNGAGGILARPGPALEGSTAVLRCGGRITAAQAGEAKNSRPSSVAPQRPRIQNTTTSPSYPPKNTSHAHNAYTYIRTHYCTLVTSVTRTINQSSCHSTNTSSSHRQFPRTQRREHNSRRRCPTMVASMRAIHTPHHTTPPPDSQESYLARTSQETTDETTYSQPRPRAHARSSHVIIHHHAQAHHYTPAPSDPVPRA